MIITSDYKKEGIVKKKKVYSIMEMAAGIVTVDHVRAMVIVILQA